MKLSWGLFYVGGVALLTFGTVRTMQYFFADFYFSILDMLQGFHLPKGGILVRHLIPVVVGAICGWLFTDEPYTIAIAGCIWGAILLVWPAISNFHLVPYQLWKKRPEVNFVLGLFILSYGGLGGCGVLLGELVQSGIAKSWLGQSILSNLISAGLTVVITLWYTGKLSGLHQQVRGATASTATATTATGTTVSESATTSTASATGTNGQ